MQQLAAGDIAESVFEVIVGAVVTGLVSQELSQVISGGSFARVFEFAFSARSLIGIIVLLGLMSAAAKLVYQPSW